MEEIKLIALDLDGTLLDNQKRLSYRTKQALEECIHRDILIVPCTGRIWGGVPEVLRRLRGIRYAITVNGAVIEDIAEHKILDERKLSCGLAVEILELARQFHTMYDAYVGGMALGEARFIDHMDDYGIEQSLRPMVRKTRQIVPDVITELRRRDRPVEKINYFFGDPQERLRARKALLDRGDVIVSSSFSNNLEINAPGATKGEAILRLANLLGIPPHQTMGVGDGENDLTMMEMAGVGVAMENGVDSVKERADYVTGTNEADGVADAIRKLVLGTAR